MDWKLGGVAVVAALCLSSGVNARDGAEPYTIWVSGLGYSSCGQYLAAMDKHSPTEVLQQSDGQLFPTQSAAFREWTQGFLTGLSYSKYPAKRRSDDVSAMMQWIKSYCQKDPTQSFMQAVGAYADGRDL